MKSLTYYSEDDIRKYGVVGIEIRKKQRRNTMANIILLPLEPEDREQFILDNQEAFNYGAWSNSAFATIILRMKAR